MNANHISPELRSLTLHAQLHYRAADRCLLLPNNIMGSTEESDAIIVLLYKREPLFVVHSLYGDFSSLSESKRGPTETFKNFDCCFCACVSKYLSRAISISLPNSIHFLMLLYSTNVFDRQKISTLYTAAAAPFHGL